MRVALLQMDIHWLEHKQNLAKAEAMVEEAASRNADIAVLPEMDCNLLIIISPHIITIN